MLTHSANSPLNVMLNSFFSHNDSIILSDPGFIEAFITFWYGMCKSGESLKYRWAFYSSICFWKLPAESQAAGVSGPAIGNWEIGKLQIRCKIYSGWFWKISAVKLYLFLWCLSFYFHIFPKNLHLKLCPLYLYLQTLFCEPWILSVLDVS